MNETEIKQMIEQIGYQEFYRYFQEKTKLITNLQEENQKLNKIIDELEKWLNKYFVGTMSDAVLNKLTELKKDLFKEKI